KTSYGRFVRFEARFIIEKEFDAGILEVNAKPVDKLLHSVRWRHGPANLPARRSVCLQMIGQCCAAKYQTCAEPFRIARINPAQRRHQQIVSRSATDHSLTPVNNNFELSRMKTCRVRRKSESQRHHIRSRQRQLS